MRKLDRRFFCGFTLVELLVVIAIIGALVGLLLPAVQAARESARKTTCVNHLKQQGLALLNYHDTHNEFPLGLYDSVGGKNENDGYGWALALLPYLEQQALFDVVDPDWEPGIFLRTVRTPSKKIPGGDTILDVFRCPSSGLPEVVDLRTPHSEGYATNDYKACNGDGSSGMFYRAGDGARVDSTRVRIANVTDGLSNTISLGESAYYGEARDWPIWVGAPKTDEAVLFKTIEPSIMNCGVTPKELASFTRRIRQGGPLDDDCSFSWHSGGAHFAFADGSIHWLEESIDFQLYKNLGVKNDGKLTNGLFQ